MRYLLSIAAFCLFAVSSFAATTSFIELSGHVVTSAEPTLPTLQTSCTNNGYIYSNSTPSKYITGTFVASSSYTVKAIDIAVFKVGSPTGTYTAKIYSTSGYNPSSVLASSTTVRNASEISGTQVSMQVVSFDFSGVTLTYGTRYAIVLYSTDADGDANYVGYGIGAASCASDQSIRLSSDGASWSTSAFDQSIYFIIKG